MCLFKKSEFKGYKKYNTLVGVGVAIIFIEIILVTTSNVCENLMPEIALAQLVFSALAFILVLIALCYTANQFEINIEQYRKMMAKPELKLFFGKDDNEFGKNDKTSIEVNVDKNNYREVQLYLWIKNIGNSVARTYQIDIEVPSIFDPTNFDTKQGNLPSKLIDNGNTRIYTYYNTEKICFVNKPEYIRDSIILGLYNERYHEYENEYEIYYRVFGDWSETQEGKLKIIVKKQEEPSHAPG